MDWNHHQCGPLVSQDNTLEWHYGSWCKAAVIMDKEEYIDKIKVMLSDERMYKKLKDPTRRYMEKLVALLTGRKDKNKTSIPRPT